MATKIGRSFDELDVKIKQCDASIKEAQADIKTLDKGLKLNPGNVDLVRQKYNLLNNNLQSSSQKLTLLRSKQTELKRSFDSGNITQDEYNRKLEATARAIKRAEQQVESLTLDVMKQNQELANAPFDKYNEGLQKTENYTKKLRNVTLAATAAVVGLFVSAVNTGDELSDTATHYGTSVEELQIWSNRLGMLAKDQAAYEQSLKQLGSVMTSITAGRGARYLTYLKQLGIAQEDLKGKSNGDVFNMVYGALRNVTDETQRAIIAQGILGDTGLEIAIVAGTEQSALDELDESLTKHGLITTEQAVAADAAANRMLELKQQYEASKMELMVGLMPAFETVASILETTFIPTITKVSDWFKNATPGEQKMLLFLLGVIIILPTLINLIRGVITTVQMMNMAKSMHAMATYQQAGAMTALTTASTPWLGIIMAISAALLLLISIINMFIGKSNEAVDSANALLGKMNEIDQKSVEMGMATEYGAVTTYESNTHKTTDINLNVTASGDGTAINKENADNIANALEDKILTDLLNQGLGAVVR